jgi:hypothetical protein
VTFSRITHRPATSVAANALADVVLDHRSRMSARGAAPVPSASARETLRAMADVE